MMSLMFLHKAEFLWYSFFPDSEKEYPRIESNPSKNTKINLQINDKTNAFIEYSDFEDMKGGTLFINTERPCKLLFHSCRFFRCYSKYGGAIYVSTSKNKLQVVQYHITSVMCRSEEYGAHCYISPSSADSQNIIIDSTISQCNKTACFINGSPIEISSINCSHHKDEVFRFSHTDMECNVNHTTFSNNSCRNTMIYDAYGISTYQLCILKYNKAQTIFTLANSTFYLISSVLKHNTASNFTQSPNNFISCENLEHSDNSFDNDLGKNIQNVVRPLYYPPIDIIVSKTNAQCSEAINVYSKMFVRLRR